ncbi:MAG: APC family permease [Promethearchaeota archaeon]
MNTKEGGYGKESEKGSKKDNNVNRSDSKNLANNYEQNNAGLENKKRKIGYSSSVNIIRKLWQGLRGNRRGKAGSGEKKGSEEESAIIKKDIKIRRLIFSGMSGTVGGPIYVILGGAIKEAGPGIIISLLILGLLLIFLVMIYSELALSIPIIGGGYSFSKEAIGGFWGFLIGWLLWLGNVMFCAVSAESFGYSLAIFFPNRAGIEANYIKLIALILVIFYAMLNYQFSKFLSRLMNIFTAILIIGFIIYITIGISAGKWTNPDNFRVSNLFLPINPVSILLISPTLVTIFCLYEWNSSYATITMQIEKIKGSKEKVPKAFLLAIIFAFIIYILVGITTLINMGAPNSSTWDLITNSQSPLADTLYLVGGPILMYVIAFASMICTMTSLQSTLKMSYLIFHAMARDNYLPKIFTKKKEGKITSNWIYLIATLTVILSIFLIELNILVNISSFVIVISMSLISFSVILLRKKRPNLIRPYKVKGYPYVPIITGISFVILAVVLSPIGIILGILLLFIGIFIYTLSIARRNRIILMVAGAKISIALLLLMLVIISKNVINFNFRSESFNKFSEIFTIILIYSSMILGIISGIFDIIPLGQIFREITKQKDSDATIISQMVKISKKKEYITIRFYFTQGVLLIVFGIMLLVLSNFINKEIVQLYDYYLGLIPREFNRIAGTIFSLGATVFLITGFITILLQLEKKRVKMV